MKIFEIKNLNNPLESADLTIIRESLFSSLKELENWIIKIDLSKSGTIILISDIWHGGDFTKISEYINGTSSKVEDAEMLYNIIKGLPIEEDILDLDDCSGGVSKEEFEEHLRNASLSWDDLNKSDDNTTC